MAITEAQKRAAKKYREGRKIVSARFDISEYDNIIAIRDKYGSTNREIIEKGVEKLIEDNRKAEIKASYDKAETIKEIRAVSGLSQKKLSELFGMKEGTVTAWETGNRKPPDYVVEMIKYILINEMIIGAKK